MVPKINEGKNLSNKIKYSIYINELIKFYFLPKIIKETPEKLKQKFTLDEEYIKIMLNQYTKIGNSNGGKVTYIKSQNLILKNIYHIICLALLLNYLIFLSFFCFRFSLSGAINLTIVFFPLVLSSLFLNVHPISLK